MTQKDELDDYEELDEYNEEADPEELELEYDEEEDYIVRHLYS